MKIIFTKQIQRIIVLQGTIACIAFLFCVNGVAQEDTTSTSKKLSWGLSIGPKYAQIIAPKSKSFSENVTDNYTIEHTDAFGLSGGISVRGNLNDKFGLSFSIMADLIDTDVTLDLPSSAAIRREVFNTTAYVPLIIDYKITEAKFTPKVLAGLSFVYNMPKIGITTIEFIQYDYQALIGIGLFTSRDKFSIGADLVYGIGLSNLLYPNENPETAAFEHVKRNTIGLIFHFY